jgi:uncharacterized protein
MIENIRQISNPFLRTIVSGLFLGTLVTIPSTAAIALVSERVNTDKESAHKNIVYASLASVVVGAVGGLAFGKKPKEDEIEATEKIIEKISENEIPRKEWKDWRKFVVARKVIESDSITSFYLKPEDGEEIPNHTPGQFLTIQLEISEQPKPIIRTYSLSDFNSSPEYYRLSIKRELAPPDKDVPPGISSNFMHDRIHEGSVILAKPPAGKFVLDVKGSHPAVLISNGVGITPMIAMAKAVSRLNPNRHIWFLHGARDGSLHAFRDEVNAIALSNPNLHIIYCYSRPAEADATHYQHKGYVDAALIKEVVAPEMQKLSGSTDAEYFLCGSPSFMDSLRDGLREWGVADSKVLFESFAKAKPKKSEVSLMPSEVPVSEIASAQPQEVEKEITDSVEILFNQSGKTFNWTPNDGSILEFAEENDIYPDNSCRAGICGTCMCKIIEGEVEYLETPTASIDRGSVLICISKPKTAMVVLDI